MRCLRKMAHVNWWDRIPNMEALTLCGIMGTEAMLMNKQFRWICHVMKMDDTWIPKMVFYCRVVCGKRSIGGQYKRCKDVLKANVKSCSISPNDLEMIARDRWFWQQTITLAFKHFYCQCIQTLQEKRRVRKGCMAPTVVGFYVTSAIGFADRGLA